MDVRFNSTRAFEKQLDSLTSKERARIAAKINQLAELYSADSAGLTRHATPFSRKVLGGYDSSLYTARLSHKDRLIFSAEDDPIQGEVVLTLFALITPDMYGRTMENITESLYQERLHADDVEGLVHDTV
jgi:mRNA-degrading endonuclease RelE of RelBE toxin-antitoxin system